MVVVRAAVPELELGLVRLVPTERLDEARRNVQRARVTALERSELRFSAAGSELANETNRAGVKSAPTGGDTLGA